MVNDLISDLLTRVRNAHLAGHKSVVVPMSNKNRNVLTVLKDEGFIESFSEQKEAFGAFSGLQVVLKYYPNGEPAISVARRISKPGRRMYLRSEKLPKIHNGLGIAVISTSQGVMSDREARRRKIGGEILAQIA